MNWTIFHTFSYTVQKKINFGVLSSLGRAICGISRFHCTVTACKSTFCLGCRLGEHIFTVLNYCILISKVHIYCQTIHNDNAIDLFQHLVELKKPYYKQNIILMHHALWQERLMHFSFHMNNCKMFTKLIFCSNKCGTLLIRVCINDKYLDYIPYFINKRVLVRTDFNILLHRSFALYFNYILFSCVC